ncbi:BFP_1a_G0033200.mRNA.1.CDS.1 [Saccharomyces cerevisiae]|nr:BFP_1a_G0033200.mRNA.1.CDS.1 [Saccharomyces cerevisiae]CAI7208696.1 BFP_1a_G0033200.mRNA.1.CDS.1 [Saccharomyces cerevisiae]
MLECLSALLVLFAGGGGSVLAAVQSKTVADPNLCPGYNSQLISPFLSSCKRNLSECVSRYFDEQYAFCRSCVTVNNETMEDLDNCKCLQCALSSLNNSCFHDYCTSKDEYDKLQIVVEQFQLTNGVLDDGEILKPRGNKFSSRKLSYFVGQNNTLFRNPLQFEKNQLISALLTSLTNNQKTISSVDMFEVVDANNEVQYLRKRTISGKTLSPATGYEEENDGDCSVKDKKWEGKIEYHENKKVSSENCSKDTDDKSGSKKERNTKAPLFHTATEIHMTRWSSWRPKKIFTRYLVNEYQSPKIITTVNRFYRTKTDTETGTTLITSTKAKRRWFPRTKIVTSTATSTFLSITTTTTTNAIATKSLVAVLNPDGLNKKAGINFGLFSANGELASPDEGGTPTVVRRDKISDPGAANEQATLFSATFSQVPHLPELDSGEFISAASQLDKRIFIFTAITVSITTLMMLGFSYRSRVSFRDHSIDDSDDDNDWSDDEVEFDEEYFYSLPVSIPEKGISLDKMAQQLGVE